MWRLHRPEQCRSEQAYVTGRECSIQTMAVIRARCSQQWHGTLVAVSLALIYCPGWLLKSQGGQKTGQPYLCELVPDLQHGRCQLLVLTLATIIANHLHNKTMVYEARHVGSSSKAQGGTPIKCTGLACCTMRPSYLRASSLQDCVSEIVSATSACSHRLQAGLIDAANRLHPHTFRSYLAAYDA